MMDGRGARWRACLLLGVAAGGCDNVFRIDHVTYRGDAAEPDVQSQDDAEVPTDTPTDASRLACANGMPLLFEPFNAASNPCDPWAADYSDPGVTVTQTGTLNVTANPAAAAVGGCATDVSAKLSFGAGGVMAKVDAIIQNGSPYNVLTIYGPPDLQIRSDGAMLVFENTGGGMIGATNYTSEMKYWRIRPDPNALTSRIVGEFSTNGTDWTSLNSYTTTVPTMVGVELSFGTETAGGSGTARVDELLVCP